jgi:aminopeptidase
MNDPRINKLAKLLVNYSTKVEPKDLVAITALTPATPLVQELFRETLRSGGYPYFLSRGFPPYVPGLENNSEIFFKAANDDQLKHVDLFFNKVVEEFDVLISVLSFSNKRNIANVDPSRISQRKLAHSEVTNTLFKRAASGELRRVLTLFPTQGYAQDAEMSLAEFEEYVFSTMYIDADDPVARWQNIHNTQQRIVDLLAGKSKLEIKGPNVDLIMSIEGRTFINCAGEGNIPDGEIFTGPVEESVNGWIRFTYPDYVTGREISGIELQFKDGKVEKASATKNEDALLEGLDTDAGARYVGELGIGTNERVNRRIKAILFDEKIGGTIHLALGHGYPGTGSKNESAIHWDMLCDMKDGGQILVDDELFYESGEFII